ncbi:MAG: phosphatase PAP2 family protein [Solobacterium sp.]|jgi:membrane-associated phospholipid phosphatase|nr:phosphatase PAP2 family protein [Solobacterium sp.]
MEIQFLNWLQSVRVPMMDFLMPLVSDGIVLFLIAPFILLFRKSTRRTGIIVLIAIVLDIVLCNGILKNLFQRVRPCDVNTAVVLLVPRPTDYSFPSGHTALSFAVVAVLGKSDSCRKWRVPAMVLACMIAFSRMYLYLHYPTDILAGIVCGVFCGWAASRIADYLFRFSIMERQMSSGNL